MLFLHRDGKVFIFGTNVLHSMMHYCKRQSMASWFIIGDFYVERRLSLFLFDDFSVEIPPIMQLKNQPELILKLKWNHSLLRINNEQTRARPGRDIGDALKEKSRKRKWQTKSQQFSSTIKLNVIKLNIRKTDLIFN